MQFAKAYRVTSRPCMPPELLLKALLLVTLYAVRSERQGCERIVTDLLSHGFFDLHPSDDTFDAARPRQIVWRSKSSTDLGRNLTSRR